MRIRTLRLLPLLALALTAAPALAAPGREVLICHVSDVGSKGDVQPTLDRFGAYLAGKLGWEPGSWRIRMETTRAGGLAQLEKDPPAFAALSLGMFLERHDTAGLVPLVVARVDGATTERYRVLTKKGGPATLTALKGKVLTGDAVDDVPFLSRIVFGGGLDAAAHFTLERARRPLKAIRQVARGKADAVLVSEGQYASLKGLPLMDQLQVVFTSEPLPRLGLVWMKGRVDEAQALRLQQALAGMCGDAQGKEICELFGLDGFEPVPAGAFDAVIKQYGGAR